MENLRLYGRYVRYILGYTLCASSTFFAYVVVMHHVYTGRALEMILVASCLAQLLAQFLCFLHIKKKWDLLVFFLMLVIAMIFVGGSFWVMDSLNYYDMPGM